jgi:hypothetical protein
MPDRHAPKPRHSSPSSLSLLLAIALIPIVLTGCGTSSEEDVTTKPAAQILAAAANTARNASSVQVVSKISEGKRQVSIHLQLAGEKGGSARTSRGLQSGETIRVANTVYTEVGPVLARQLAQTTGAHVPVGSWLQAPASDLQLTQSAFLTKSDGELLFLLRAPTLSLTKGAVVTVNGQKAIELKTKGKLYTGKIYVAVIGKPYPIEIVRQPSGRGEETSHTTFTNWNHSIHIDPPPNATPLASLEHKTNR